MFAICTPVSETVKRNAEKEGLIKYLKMLDLNGVSQVVPCVFMQEEKVFYLNKES